MRGDSSFDSGYYIAERFRTMYARPEAVFCDSDSIALGALRTFSDKWIRIPDDVKVLSGKITDGTNELSHIKIAPMIQAQKGRRESQLPEEVLLLRK